MNMILLRTENVNYFFLCFSENFLLENVVEIQWNFSKKMEKISYMLHLDLNQKVSQKKSWNGWSLTKSITFKSFFEYVKRDEMILLILCYEIRVYRSYRSFNITNFFIAFQV